jgi:hypothetical protein
MLHIQKDRREIGAGAQIPARNGACSAECSPSTPRLTSLLAPGNALALPSLAGVPKTYQHWDGTEDLLNIARTLVRKGIATPEHWKKFPTNPVGFVGSALDDWLDKHGAKLIKKQVSYNLCLSTMFDEHYGTPKKNVAYLSVYSNGSGYLKLGHALDLLDAEQAGLGEAFFSTLIPSLYHWMRIYDYQDAQQYEEMLRENAEMESEEDREQYEFPEVDEAIPAFLKKKNKKSGLASERLLRKHQHGRYGSWIRHVLAISKYAKEPIPRSCIEVISSEFDQYPLPCWLIVFEDKDAVETCFDEEAQTYYEGSAAPSLALKFNPNSPQEITQVLDSLRSFVDVNRELCLLTEEVHAEEEKTHGHRNSNLAEHQRRAA